MDNFFISLPLFRALREKEIYVIGTLRLERGSNEARLCLVPPEQLHRGQMFIATSDDNITLVRWMDRRAVHTLLTYAGFEATYKQKKRGLNSVTHLKFNNITWCSWGALI